MGIFFQLLSNLRFLKLEDWRIDRAANRLLLRISSRHNVGHCPLCEQPSTRIHSHYYRTVADLPWMIFSVVLQLKVHKFFCDNGSCRRRIFTERLPGFVAPWARRTQRLADRLTAIGLALGGAAGARLSQRLGMGVCRNTLLKLVRGAPMPLQNSPKIVGVDDLPFANATPTARSSLIMKSISRLRYWRIAKLILWRTGYKITPVLKS